MKSKFIWVLGMGLLMFSLVFTTRFLINANEISRLDVRSVAVEVESLPLQIPTTPISVEPTLKEPSLEDISVHNESLTHLEFLSSLAHAELGLGAKNE